MSEMQSMLRGMLAAWAEAGRDGTPGLPSFALRPSTVYAILNEIAEAEDMTKEGPQADDATRCALRELHDIVTQTPPSRPVEIPTRILAAAHQRMQELQ